MNAVVIDAPGKLGKIVVGMNKVLGDIPVTVKLRTGVREGKNTAHKLMPRVAEWGASCLTVSAQIGHTELVFILDSYMEELANNDTLASLTGITSGNVLRPFAP
jgi:tRNA-dihydrouridine synthase 3